MAELNNTQAPIDAAIKYTVKEIVSDIWVDIKDIKRDLAVKADKQDVFVLESRVRLIEDKTQKLETQSREETEHRYDFRWWIGAALVLGVGLSGILMNVINMTM